MPKSVSPPKYRHFRPRNLAVVRIEGRDHYLGRYGSDESREADARLITKHQAEPAPVVPNLVAADITITELVIAYFRYAESYYVKNGRPSGRLAVIRQALKTLRLLYGETKAAAFGPLAFKSVQSSLIQSGKSRVYINDLCDSIRRSFKWAASNELLHIAVYQALQTVSGLKRGRSKAKECPKVKPVDDATVDATLPHLPPVVADMVRIQRLVGCRPSEVCLLRPCDLDTTVEPWLYVPLEHKSEHRDHERRIFVGPRAQDVLRSYLLRPANEFCFSPRDSEKRRLAELREKCATKTPPSRLNRRKLQPTRVPSERYNKDSYNRAVSRAVNKANKSRLTRTKEELGRDQNGEETAILRLESWSPNQLRHAVATDIRRQFGIEAAQTVLGHSKADVTQIYAERDWRKAAEVMTQIG